MSWKDTRSLTNQKLNGLFKALFYRNKLSSYTYTSYFKTIDLGESHMDQIWYATRDSVKDRHAKASGQPRG